MDQITAKKTTKTTKTIKCSDCYAEILGNTQKQQALMNTLNLTENAAAICVRECEHPMCNNCIKKTSRRFSREIGVCDQCMWWAIT